MWGWKLRNRFVMTIPQTEFSKHSTIIVPKVGWPLCLYQDMLKKKKFKKHYCFSQNWILISIFIVIVTWMFAFLSSLFGWTSSVAWPRGPTASRCATSTRPSPGCWPRSTTETFTSGTTKHNNWSVLRVIVLYAFMWLISHYNFLYKLTDDYQATWLIWVHFKHYQIISIHFLIEYRIVSRQHTIKVLKQQ